MKKVLYLFLDKVGNKIDQPSGEAFSLYEVTYLEPVMHATMKFNRYSIQYLYGDLYGDVRENCKLGVADSDLISMILKDAVEISEEDAIKIKHLVNHPDSYRERLAKGLSAL